MSKYISFSIFDKLYLMDVNDVHSIIKKKKEEIKSIPEAPDYFLGVTELRDKIIGIISGNMIFDLKKRKDKIDEYYIIIIKYNKELFGLVVDEILDIKQIDENNLQSNFVINQLNTYSSSVYNDGQKLYLVIDVERMIESKNIKEVSDENKI